MVFGAVHNDVPLDEVGDGIFGDEVTLNCFMQRRSDLPLEFLQTAASGSGAVSQPIV